MQISAIINKYEFIGRFTSSSTIKQNKSSLAQWIVPLLNIQYKYFNMDDFDEIYLQRHRKFEEGLKKGIEEADAYDMKDKAKQGEQFGQEFVKQLAIYQSFYQVIQRMKNNEQASHQKYHKIQEIIEEVQSIATQIDYSSLEELRAQRESMSKKFKLLMTMLGVKKNVQTNVFEIKKAQQALDF